MTEQTTILIQPKRAVAAKIESSRRRAIRRFLRHRLALVGLATIAIIVVLAIIGSEQAAYQQNLRMGWTNQPPGTTFVVDDPDGTVSTVVFPLGTDALGRDVLARVLVGGRVSLLVALISVFVSTIIGVVVGVFSGYAGGKTDATMMRFVDVALSFPVILLLLVVSALVGPGLITLIVMIGVVTWAQGARIIRGQVLAMRGAAYIEAARVIGVSGFRMVRSHVLPNIVAPIVVLATFGVATVVIFEAGLSYLGLGVQPPTPSWGNMVNAAKSITVLERYPWQWVPPALFIVAMVMAVNFVGDGLRDAFDMRATSDR